MSGRRKSTPEVMDRIIQVIWHYQQLHRGLTPNYGVIANELDLGASNRVATYVNNLVKDGRLDKHHIRPFRATILTHPKNTSAIRRYEKFLRKQDEHPEDEIRQTITAKDKPEVAPVERKPEVKPLPEPEPPSPQIEPQVPLENFPEEVVMRTTEVRRSFVPPRHMNWNEASAIVAAHGGDLNLIASTFIIKTARDGDLLAELLDRGYTIKKSRPSRS